MHLTAAPAPPRQTRYVRRVTYAPRPPWKRGSLSISTFGQAYVVAARKKRRKTKQNKKPKKKTKQNKKQKKTKHGTSSAVGMYIVRTSTPRPEPVATVGRCWAPAVLAMGYLCTYRYLPVFLVGDRPRGPKSGTGGTGGRMGGEAWRGGPCV